MTDGRERNRSERLKLSVYPETKRLIEEAADESHSRRDLPDLSLSQIGCYMIEQSVEEGLLDETVESLIPDELIRAHRVVRKRERIKAETYVEDLAGGWRGRAKSALNARLSGENPYKPEYIRPVMDGFREEARLYFDGEELQAHLRWLDDRVSAYIDSYRAKTAVPDPLFDDVDDVEVGRDLWSLRERGVEVVETIESVAESEAYDPEAILDRLSNDWGVSERALRLVLDWMTEEDTTVERALKSGDKLRFHLPDRALTDGSDPEIDSDQLMRVEEAPTDRFDDDTQTLQFRGEDLDTEESEPEIDGEELADLMPGQGGVSDD